MRHLAVTLFLAVASTIGCNITSDKHGEGQDVKVATPFGGLSVKTDQSDDVLFGIGLPLYPGASLVKKDKDNNNSADVNMSFGSFQLKVKAVEYRTGDSPDKVLAFYKKGLGHFGDVIQCEGKHPVGMPAHTSEGLSCDDSTHSSKASPDAYSKAVHISGSDLQINGSGSDKDTKYQLKAGSRKHQHIVDIDPDGSGTKFGLVALDLPVDFHFGDKDTDEDKEKDKQ